MDENDVIRPVKAAFGAHHLLWLNLLQQVEDGKIKRLLGLMPPGSGKSIFTSVVFPTHIMGRFPKFNVIMTSYGDVLPRKFGRRARSIVTQSIYKRIFNCTLSDESQAVDEWALTNGSEWMAAGIMTGITGNRADLVIWDDPIKGREQADSETVRQKTWDAYIDDLLTRKKPDAREVGILCMTGDTPVTMWDGTKKYLRDVRPGDWVLSWKDGEAVSREVLNWKSQGLDKVYEVRTGGNKVKANAQHPFLVKTENGYKWIKVKDLKKGDTLVSFSRLPDLGKSTLVTTDMAWLLGYMFGDGWITIRKTKQNYKGRIYQSTAYVTCIAQSNDEDENKKVADLFYKIFNVYPKLREKQRTRVTEKAFVGRWFLNMGLTGKAATKRLPQWLYSEPESVRAAFLAGFVDADGHINSKGRSHITSCNPPLLEDLQHLARGLGCRVTNLHIHQDWMQAPNSPKPTFSTSGSFAWQKEKEIDSFTTRTVTSLKELDYEEVFDLEIDDTECFIAHGLVSHNTHWQEDDPAGRILPEKYNGESGFIQCRDGNEWYVLCLPAEAEREDDPLGRKVGERIWPEWFPEDHFAPFKRQPRTWSSLYQQRPAPESGEFFQAMWLKPYEKLPDTEEMRIYGASDYAVSKDKGDYTVHIVVGIDSNDDIWVLDLWRGRTTPDIWIREFCDRVEKWRPLGWAEETGQIHASVGPFLSKSLRDRQLYIARAEFPSKKNKEVRAQSIRGRMAQKGLHIPIGAPWYPDFRNELMVFPNGTHDDQVDALSLIGQILDKMVKGSKASKEAEKPKVFSTDPRECTVTMDDLWKDHERRSNKIGRNLRIV